MREEFGKHSFTPARLEMVETCNAILDEYREQGFRLSLRQLYYQNVARGYIPNSQQSYKSLGDLVTNARLAGIMDWSMIEDRGRRTVSTSHWAGPDDIITSAARGFRIDKWFSQKWHIEVMVEKDALSGVLDPVCRELDISITANKGYSSASTMYEIGKRLRRKYQREMKNITILYLGDHDPSGIDMGRDVKERLTQFSKLDEDDVEIIRLALNIGQVRRWNPPENPAKQTDSRFSAYEKEFGESSWELDAVEPVELASLVRQAVFDRRDDQEWERSVKQEEQMRAELRQMAGQYRADHADSADYLDRWSALYDKDDDDDDES